MDKLSAKMTEIWTNCVFVCVLFYFINEWRCSISLVLLSQVEQKQTLGEVGT